MLVLICNVYLNCFHLLVVGEVVGVGLTVVSTVFAGVLWLILDWIMTCGVVTITSSSTKEKGYNQNVNVRIE